MPVTPSADPAKAVGWDGNADLSRGHIGIWRFARDERMEDVGAIPFGR